VTSEKTHINMDVTPSDSGIQLLGKTLLEKDFIQIQEIYGDDNLFPLEVRLHLSDWIEEQFIPLVSTGCVDIFDPTHQQMATNTAMGLVQQLDTKVQTMSNDTEKFLTKIKLQKVSDNIKQTFGNDPVGLYNLVIGKLEKEMQLIAQVPVDAVDVALAEMTAESQNSTRIRQELSILKQKIGETATQLRNCRTEHEEFSVEYYACKGNANKLQALQQQYGEEDSKVKAFKVQKEALDKQIKTRYSFMQRHQAQLANEFVGTYTSVKEVQDQVLDVELVRWTKEQQMAGNGFPASSTFIDTLQEWCEGLADVIWPLRQQVGQLQELKAKLVSSDQQTSNVNLQELQIGITNLLSNLVTRTFVIEKQPPQVMKTNTRFPCTVRLLVAGVLNIHMAAPVVYASIVSESQANQLASAAPGVLKRKEDYNSGDILNSQGQMEYHAETRKVSVSFKNLQLKKIKRTEKKGTECVMDEKFSILFWTEFSLQDLNFQLWTFSLPVVVIVHGNQESQALATVVWDNGFAEMGRRLFYVPDKVTWGQAAEVLNMKWTAACGSRLTEDNLYCLACKALRENNIPKIPEDYNNRMLSWSQFCKENLPNRTFTFWEWFYRILLLTSAHMKKPWSEGLITGFVLKQEAERMLKQQQHGCFLLRYSDSELGGVSIGYVKRTENQAPHVQFLYPFSSKDLAQRSIAQVVFDVNELSLLYPSISKEVFRKHIGTSIQEKKPGNPGYIKHEFVTKLQGAESTQSTPEIKYEIGSPPQNFMPTWEAFQDSSIPTAISGGFDDALLNAQYSLGDDMEMGDIDLAGLIDVSDIINLASPSGPQLNP